MSKRKLLKENGDTAQNKAKRIPKKIDRYGNFEKENFNDLFPAEDKVMNISPTVIEAPNISDSFRKNNRKSEIFSHFDLMEERVKNMTELLIDLSQEVQGLYKKPVLKINEKLEDEQEKDLLDKFTSYKLPISERDQLEQLETELRLSDSFNIFFVSCLQYTCFITNRIFQEYEFLFCFTDQSTCPSCKEFIPNTTANIMGFHSFTYIEEIIRALYMDWSQ